MIPLEGINAMREFLARTTLKGTEVDAFNRCVGFLYNEEKITRTHVEDEDRAMRERNKTAFEAQQKALAPQVEE